MIVSVTEIQQFQRCRRAWSYSSFNQQSLGPIVPNRALSLGKTIHRAFAQWLIESNATTATTTTTPRPFNALFLTAAQEELVQIKDAYLRQVKAPISESELGPYYDGVDMGLALTRNYEAKWGTPLPTGFTLIAPEQQVEIPISGTEYDHYHSAHYEDDSQQNYERHIKEDHNGIDDADTYHTHTHRLSARMDAIIRRDSTGDLYILEHKTYASRPKPEILQAAFQFQAYEWAAQQLNIGTVAGTAYDGLWKRAVPPRGNTQDDLFTRLLIAHPQEQLRDVQETITSVVLDMADSPRIYPNRRWEGCLYDCAFENLCTAQSRGEDVEWIKQARYQRLDQDKEPVHEDE